MLLIRYMRVVNEKISQDVLLIKNMLIVKDVLVIIDLHSFGNGNMLSPKNFSKCRSL